MLYKPMEEVNFSKENPFPVVYANYTTCTKQAYTVDLLLYFAGVVLYAATLEIWSAEGTSQSEHHNQFHILSLQIPM